MAYGVLDIPTNTTCNSEATRSLHHVWVENKWKQVYTPTANIYLADWLI
jgi:hypothetical protein